jgi:hypothetical protein
MSLKSLTRGVTSKAGRQVLKVRKHSPVLLFGTGVVGVVATVVLASKATLKMDEVLSEFEADKAKIDAAPEAAKEIDEEYTEEDAKKDSLGIKVKLATKIVRLYAPAVAVGVVSIGCLTGAHVILSRRNVALTAAYAALDKGFREYRARVVQELGEEKDLKFRHGLVEKEIVEEGPNGPEHKTVLVPDPSGNNLSIYARMFAQHTSTQWEEAHTRNQFFVQCQENYANQRLRAKGVVFLNEVYEMLGMEKTDAGQIVGWIDNGEGDGQIDFGVFSTPAGVAFANYERNSVMLDFNVDGPVYHLLTKQKEIREADDNK